MRHYVLCVGDRLRRDYDGMTFEEFVAVWGDIARWRPEQGLHANVDAIYDGAPAGTVAEVGCWRGELAAALLPRLPDVKHWNGYDLLPLEPRCLDGRFHFLQADTWPWHIRMEADVVIAAHVLEHMSEIHAQRFFAALEAPRVYVEVPAPATGPVFRGNDATHILMMNWRDLLALAARYGYAPEKEGVRENMGKPHPWHWAWLRRSDFL